MSTDVRRDIDQVNKMVSNLLELADEAIEEDSPLDAEQVKEMAAQIQELLSEIFENDIEGWNQSDNGDAISLFDSDD